MKEGVESRGELASLWPALRAQGRVIHGLFLREAESRRGRSFALGYLAASLEPLIIIGAISTLFYLLNRQAAYGSNLLVFVGTGVFPVYLFLHTSMRIREPFGGAEAGRFPVETSLDHVFVHAVLHAFSSIAVAVLFFSFCYFYFHRPEAIPFDIPRAMAALSAIFVLGVAMGIANSVIAKLVPLWNTIWPGIARASIHFSGMYFVADFLPPTTRDLFAMNPILHGVSWFRTAFYPTYPRIIDNHAYILVSALVAITIGLMLEKRFRRVMAEGE